MNVSALSGSIIPLLAGSTLVLLLTAMVAILYDEFHDIFRSVWSLFLCLWNSIENGTVFLPFTLLLISVFRVLFVYFEACRSPALFPPPLKMLARSGICLQTISQFCYESEKKILKRFSQGSQKNVYFCLKTRTITMCAYAGSRSNQNVCQ